MYALVALAAVVGLALVGSPLAAQPPAIVNGTPREGPRARAVAVAESTDLRDGRVAVLESLDLYNDDLRRPLLILGVFADTWLGHRREASGESWLPAAERRAIPPGGCERIVSRQRIVAGRPGKCWYVRWLCFKVATDQGDFYSNFTSSPVRMPGALDDERAASELAPQAYPDDLSPLSRASSPATVDRPVSPGRP